LELKKSLEKLQKHWPRILIILWFLLPAVFAVVKYSLGAKAYNNYLIYKHVFLNIIREANLYDFYPGLYLYQNHYGPSFSFIIAPFALMPDAIGIVFWCLVNALFLFYAIKKLPLDNRSIQLVMSISLLEMSGSIQSQQFNPILCSWIILAFVYMLKDRTSFAAFFISGGLLVKLYGVVGLLFTPFSGKYTKMILWMLIAMVVLICIPMLYADASFVLHAYVDWYQRLLGKNQENIMTNFTDGMQDISAMGMVRRITGINRLSNLFFLLPAGVLTLLPLLKRKYYEDNRFKLFYLAQVLIGLVIFSTSAESPTYVIAVTGFAIWYAAFGEERPQWMKWMLALLFLLTILSSTDLFPLYVRNTFIKPFALKALPCVLAWLVITYQLLFYRGRNVDAVQTTR
jgi:hypothetical protein